MRICDLRPGQSVLWVGRLSENGEVIKRVYRLIQPIGNHRWLASRQSAGQGIIHLTSGDGRWHYADGTLPGSARTRWSRF